MMVVVRTIDTVYTIFLFFDGGRRLSAGAYQRTKAELERCMMEERMDETTKKRRRSFELVVICR